MNYIKAINNFWKLQDEHSFNGNQIALYFYLLKLSLEKTTFKRINAKVMADLNVSYKTLHNSRNRLKQAGLIDFKTKNGSAQTIYIVKNG